MKLNSVSAEFESMSALCCVVWDKSLALPPSARPFKVTGQHLIPGFVLPHHQVDVESILCVSRVLAQNCDRCCFYYFVRNSLQDFATSSVLLIKSSASVLLQW